MRVLLTGGGTAGHINPALAIAELIRRNSAGAEVAFVGIRGGKEDDLVPREGYRLYYVKSKGIRRSLRPSAVVSNVQALWLAAWSPYARSTRAILDEFRPDIVIGTGGYACWPIMAAAARRGIPTALHESNALPGLAVRKLQKKVDRIWTNFEGTADLLDPAARVKRVGNPLRGGFGAIPRGTAKERLGLGPSEKLVLCFGGSLGAEPLNRAVVEAMRALAPKWGNVRFCLASGKRDYAALGEVWCAAGLDAASNCTLVDYIYDMPLWMSAADLAVTRAGAMTLSELGRMSLPSVLVPSPHVADNHQYLNAKTFADAGAAVLIEEKELEGGRLTAELDALLGDDARLLSMSRAAAPFAGTDAGKVIWEDILALTEKKEV
ncbi:MAG TPA: UDP-N-acetylglucosamine--N-acetylmuramyl-(pentapeptide) pyrophosphoryl-undecaprenol N-acetylglucosamine transferase [Clostridiales bacterium]|nr:UDP-N-acetylglucosamine--N-acetylmuramyl-(pentapeptide) pyrophosphoryl-undecaprenol N-acetylglucosamine transferase [Clostridiales bacterium]